MRPKYKTLKYRGRTINYNDRETLKILKRHVDDAFKLQESKDKSVNNQALSVFAEAMRAINGSKK